MKRFTTRVAGLLGAACAVSFLFTATAHAEPATVHFSAGSIQCAISGNGTVGCDLPYPMPVVYGQLPFGFPVGEIVLDVPWLPAHPTFTPGAQFTIPGGNPPLDAVKTGDGQWGPYIDHAGVRCEIGFHGSFGCTIGNRGFSIWSGRIAA
ncbi:MAG TPA: hypothetical protein VK083_12990 [Nocardia sp.]|uniref:hypothetical protein n=1 Tax=Nocardia sp. TaxID=1821 RepID=UPI002B4B5532|nr:hypothetical protein [Nocardia sp.]HLS77697.1 hypothetical protein [Nocardia sp.]